MTIAEYNQWLKHHSDYLSEEVTLLRRVLSAMVRKYGENNIACVSDLSVDFVSKDSQLSIRKEKYNRRYEIEVIDDNNRR